MSVGYLPHGFDLFNVEHLGLVAAASGLCDRLVVGVYDDDEVLARTGRPPVVPLAERLDIVGCVRGVDEVVVHSSGADLSGLSVLVSEADLADWSGPGSGPVTVLPVTRTSTSPVLLRALRVVTGEAVA